MYLRIPAVSRGNIFYFWIIHFRIFEWKTRNNQKGIQIQPSIINKIAHFTSVETPQSAIIIHPSIHNAEQVWILSRVTLYSCLYKLAPFKWLIFENRIFNCTKYWILSSRRNVMIQNKMAKGKVKKKRKNHAYDQVN